MAPLTICCHTDGLHVAFICESERWEWCCNNCNRNYHSFASLTRHLHRMHQVTAFVMDCQTCRVLFENRRAYNSHMKKCGTAAPSGAQLHQCGACGAQYLRRESLELHHVVAVSSGALHTSDGSRCIWLRQPVLWQAMAKPDEPCTAYPQQTYGRVAEGQEPGGGGDSTDAAAVDGGTGGGLPGYS